jgi:hypothetical protein
VVPAVNADGDIRDSPGGAEITDPVGPSCHLDEDGSAVIAADEQKAAEALISRSWKRRWQVAGEDKCAETRCDIRKHFKLLAISGGDLAP